MEKKAFKYDGIKLEDFRGKTWENLFDESLWMWHHKRFRWMGMMSFEIYEIDAFGIKVRCEVVKRTFTYYSSNLKKGPFTTRTYYVHPNGSLRKTFVEVMTDVNDILNEVTPPSTPIYAL